MEGGRREADERTRADMYVKVFSKILDSSVWLESHTTRIVWLTLLASMDEHGFAQFAGIGNVARRAIVTLDEARTAIHTLESPDPDSSDPENDGRRIERVPGGWMVLNAVKHRDLATRAHVQEQTRLRVAKHRARKTPRGAFSPIDVTPSQPSNALSNGEVTPVEAEAEAEREAEGGRGLEGGRGTYGDGDENSAPGDENVPVRVAEHDGAVDAPFVQVEHIFGRKR
jgi:hypothetical protein